MLSNQLLNAQSKSDLNQLFMAKVKLVKEAPSGDSASSNSNSILPMCTSTLSIDNANKTFDGGDGQTDMITSTTHFINANKIKNIGCNNLAAFKEILQNLNESATAYLNINTVENNFGEFSERMVKKLDELVVDLEKELIASLRKSYPKQVTNMQPLTIIGSTEAKDRSSTAYDIIQIKHKIRDYMNSLLILVHNDICEIILKMSSCLADKLMDTGDKADDDDADVVCANKAVSDSTVTKAPIATPSAHKQGTNEPSQTFKKLPADIKLSKYGQPISNFVEKSNAEDARSSSLANILSATESNSQLANGDNILIPSRTTLQERLRMLNSNIKVSKSDNTSTSQLPKSKGSVTTQIYDSAATQAMNNPLKESTTTNATIKPDQIEPVENQTNQNPTKQTVPECQLVSISPTQSSDAVAEASNELKQNHFTADTSHHFIKVLNKLPASPPAPSLQQKSPGKEAKSDEQLLVTSSTQHITQSLLAKTDQVAAPQNKTKAIYGKLFSASSSSSSAPKQSDIASAAALKFKSNQTENNNLFDDIAAAKEQHLARTSQTYDELSSDTVGSVTPNLQHLNKDRPKRPNVKRPTVKNLQSKVDIVDIFETTEKTPLSRAEEPAIATSIVAASSKVTPVKKPLPPTPPRAEEHTITKTVASASTVAPVLFKPLPPPPPRAFVKPNLVVAPSNTGIHPATVNENTIDQDQALLTPNSAALSPDSLTATKNKQLSPTSQSANTAEQPKISLSALENIRLRKTVAKQKASETSDGVADTSLPDSNPPTPPNKLGNRFSMFEQTLKTNALAANNAGSAFKKAPLETVMSIAESSAAPAPLLCDSAVAGTSSLPECLNDDSGQVKEQTVATPNKPGRPVFNAASISSNSSAPASSRTLAPIQTIVKSNSILYKLRPVSNNREKEDLPSSVSSAVAGGSVPGSSSTTSKNATQTFNSETVLTDEVAAATKRSSDNSVTSTTATHISSSTTAQASSVSRPKSVIVVKK